MNRAILGYHILSANGTTKQLDNVWMLFLDKAFPMNDIGQRPDEIDISANGNRVLATKLVEN